MPSRTDLSRLATWLFFWLPLALHATEKPNILLILADDLGYADPSFTAGADAIIATPNIDRIAKEGVRLDRFYVCPVCSPTRVGTLTGRWPITMGFQESALPPWRDRGLEADVSTLPEILAEQGYTRRACIGKWHIGHLKKRYWPTYQGFNHFYGHLNGGIDYFEHTSVGERDWFREEESVDEPGYTTDLLTDDAIHYIEASVKAEEPFFIYLPYNAPHSPFQAPEDELAAIEGYEGKKKIYAAMVRSLDKGIGRILDALDTHGIAENTLVLFFSDNGGVKQVSSNAPYRGGKFSVLEGGVRVCASARWPDGGISDGHVVSGEPIGYIDVLPTLCAAAGMDRDAYDPNHVIDGINVLEVLRGNSDAPSRDWFHYLFQSPMWNTRSVMRYPYKLIWTRQLDQSGALVQKRIELYDLDNSPDESNDIAEEHPEKVRKLLDRIDSFLERQVDPIGHYESGKEGFVPPRNWVVP